jgi:RND family efflux transporter MFP subunit
MKHGRSVPAALFWLAAVGILGGTQPARAGSATATARARTVAVPVRAYARVEPVTVVPLKAAHAGIVAGLTIAPGEPVQAGAILGHLQGPPVEAAMARRSSDVASAQAETEAARKTLLLVREKRAARLGTLEEVYRAEAALAGAQARLGSARAQLAALQSSLALRAPESGTVLRLEAASGELMASGQTVLTVQPGGGLWLVADFFGGEVAAVRKGMEGRFLPADGSRAVSVKVRTILGTVDPGGGTAVGLVPTDRAPDWRNGVAGTVTLPGAKRTFTEVPTGALILDRGKWWVLAHGPEGYRPQVVVPRSGNGASTLIERGLAPGTEILVENAYLEFHRRIRRHFQAPD